MYEMGVFWLRVATVLYGVGLLHAMAVLLRGKAGFLKYALFAFLVAAVLHLVGVVELARAIGHLPVDNFYECAAICALLIALLFLFVYWRYDFASLSVCIFPLVFVFSMVGSMERPMLSWPNSNVRNAWLLIHVLMVLLGYAALLLTAVASVFYLIQERALKQKTNVKLFSRLPPLGTLDNLVTNSMSFGFVFITLGVVAGSAWAFIESGTDWIQSPRVALAFITWGFYLVMVFLRATAGWRGRKAALMSVAVLCCSALTWAAHVGLRAMLAK
jgi:ABC-type transport system involved in cytochrome c biogenesis permease subunit